MKTKLFSIILLFCIILSNLSFSLLGVSSFNSQKASNSSSNIIGIQQQCNTLINIPKDFINMCIKVKEDFKLLKINIDKNLFFSTNNENFNTMFYATLSTTLKLKTYFIYTKYFNKNIMQNCLVCLFALLFIVFLFYLLRYIGLLKLFNGNYTNNNKYLRLHYYSV